MGRNIHEQNDEKNIHSPPANSRLARGAEAYGIAKDRRGKRGKLLANWKYDTPGPLPRSVLSPATNSTYYSTFQVAVPTDSGLENNQLAYPPRLQLLSRTRERTVRAAA